MGGPGKGSGLEAEQAGVGPGAGSPSEPTVLRDVELPEPRREAMAGVVEAARGVEQEVRGSSRLVNVFPTAPFSPHCAALVRSYPLPSRPSLGFFSNLPPWETFIN